MFYNIGPECQCYKTFFSVTEDLDLKTLARDKHSSLFELRISVELKSFITLALDQQNPDQWTDFVAASLLRRIARYLNLT